MIHLVTLVKEEPLTLVLLVVDLDTYLTINALKHVLQVISKQFPMEITYVLPVPLLAKTVIITLQLALLVTLKALTTISLPTLHLVTQPIVVLQELTMIKSHIHANHATHLA